MAEFLCASSLERHFFTAEINAMRRCSNTVENKRLQSLFDCALCAVRVCCQGNGMTLAERAKHSLAVDIECVMKVSKSLCGSSAASALSLRA